MLSPLDSLITLRSGDNASVAADKTTKMGRVHAITEEHEIMRLFFLCGVRTYYGVLFYRCRIVSEDYFMPGPALNVSLHVVLGEIQGIYSHRTSQPYSGHHTSLV